MNTTILIQGPANQISLDTISKYKEYGDVIVSCYKSDEHQINKKYKKQAKFIFLDNINVNCANYANIYLQSYSTFNGLQEVKTPLVIKTRSDESYPNLNKFIEIVKNNQKKWISNNIWFKKVEKEWLHPGDHLIGSSTDLLLKTFKETMILCERFSSTIKQFTINDFGFDEIMSCQYPSGYLFPENVLFLNFLKIKYQDLFKEYLLKNNSKEGMIQIMKDNSELVDLNCMHPFTWSFVLDGRKQYFNDLNIALNWQGSPAISSLEEL